MSFEIEAVGWFSVIVAQHINLTDIEEYQISVELNHNPPEQNQDTKTIVVGLGWIRDQLQNAMNQLNQIIPATGDQ